MADIAHGGAGYTEIVRYIIDLENYTRQGKELIRAHWAINRDMLKELNTYTDQAKNKVRELNNYKLQTFLGVQTQTRKLEDESARAWERAERAKTKLAEQEARNRVKIAEQAAIAEQKALEASFRRRMRQLDEERKIRAQTPVPGMPWYNRPMGNDFTLARGLRAGAGAAILGGNYNMGGGLYAAANLSQMAGFGNKALPMTMGTAAMVGGAGALALGGAGIIAMAREINTELARMSTLMGDFSANASEIGQRIDKLRDSALATSSRYGIGVGDVVRGYTQALSSGISEDRLGEFGNIAGRFATATSADMSGAVNILTSIKDAYKLSVSEVSQSSDVLFNLIDKGKLNIHDLTTNFGRLVPVASAAGISLEEISTGVAVLTRSGKTSSTAVTEMIQVINGIVSPGKQAAEMFKSLGIATGAQAFQTKNFVEVIEQIKEATAGDASIIDKLFPEDRAQRGVKSLTQLLDLVKQTFGVIGEAGTATAAAERSMDTLYSKLGRLFETIVNGIKWLGDTLADTINTSLNWMIPGTADDREEYYAKVKANTFKAGAEQVKKAGSAGYTLSATEIEAQQMQASITGDLYAMSPQTAAIAARIADKKQRVNQEIDAFLSDYIAQVERSKKLLEDYDPLTEGAAGMRPLIESYNTAVRNLSAAREQAGTKKWGMSFQSDIQADEAALAASQSADYTRNIGGMLGDWYKNSSLSKTASAFAGAYKSFIDSAMKEAEDSTKKSMDAQLEYNKTFAAELNKIYKEDTERFEKEQKRKADAVRRISEQTSNAVRKAFGLDDITSALAANAFDYAGSPNAQKRIARQQKETARAELESLVQSGADPEAIEAARQRYMDSASRERGVKNDRRSARTYNEDLTGLRNFLVENEASYSAKINLAEEGKLAKISPPRTREEMLADAKAATDAKVGIKNTVENATINLKIDVEPNGEGMNEIYKYIVDRFNREKGNNTQQSSRDNEGGRKTQTAWYDE